MEKLKRLIDIRKELKKMGNFENCIDGVIGEMFAIEQMGMIKTGSGTAGIDGFLNNQTIQVKTKGGIKKYKDSEHYIEISKEHEEKIDLLLMIIIDDDKIIKCGPFIRIKCKSKLQSNNKKIRYYLHNMLKTNPSARESFIISDLVISHN
jgi:hypothetical protein